MCCNLFLLLVHVEKKGKPEKISFNLWLTARAHPPLLQPFFSVIFYTIIPKLMIKFGCFFALFQDHIKFGYELFCPRPMGSKGKRT